MKPPSSRLKVNPTKNTNLFFESQRKVGKKDLPFWDEYVDQKVPPTVGCVVAFCFWRESFTQHSGILWQGSKMPSFFWDGIEIPTDFKAPTVDRKVGLQNLGCQLWTVLKKSPILSILKINKLLEGGLWRFKQLWDTPIFRSSSILVDSQWYWSFFL